ncbi:hypothetical protein G6F31_021512 [Rhizopus arrhizus]|nr:hypothetical protein G6F31_021512 [Rhizopus arrhizus]
MGRPSATSAAKASNWSAGCMASRCTFSVRLAVRAVPSATCKQGTSQSLAMRCFFASSFSAARRRPPATTS